MAGAEVAMMPHIQMRIRALLICCCVFAPGALAEAPVTCPVPDGWSQRAVSMGQSRALSLRVLQEELRRCQTPGTEPCNPLALNMAALTRVTGAVVDKDNRDVVLFGEAQAEAPPLHTEDFIVALRSAWWRYGERKGNTIRRAEPALSIDPTTEVLKKLEALGGSLSSSQESLDAVLEQWQAVCGLPQDVRVFGVPFDTRFARVMLDADYLMKRLVDSTEGLGIEGFQGVTEMKLARVKSEVSQRRATAGRISSMNRFWFHAGPNRLAAGDGAIELRLSPVVLSTEEEFLSRTGRLSGSGRVDPDAHAFACGFTRHYLRIAEAHEVYLELENLFRFFALAKGLRHQKLFERAGLSVEFLLGGYRTAVTPVPRQVPGYGSVRGFDYRYPADGGYVIGKFRLPSCGGVSMQARIDDKNFETDRSERFAGLKTRIARLRPAPDALYWDLLATLAVNR